jgi:hypothetical protein
LRRLIRYFAIVGVLAHLAPIAAVIMALDYYDVTFRQFVQKSLDYSGYKAAWIEDLIAPSRKHTNYVMDGTIRLNHPRILLPELAAWDGTDRPPTQSRLQMYKEVGIRAPSARPNCTANLPVALGVCWVLTGDIAAAEKGVALLRRSILPLAAPPNIGTLGRSTAAWRNALAYDLLYNVPSFPDAAKREIEEVLAKALSRYLTILDDDELSLWHSRASVATQAWLMAVVLTPNNPETADLVRRAQAYFHDAMDALALTEGWPEGYNYWINNRALVLALGSAAYVNAVKNGRKSKRVREVIRRAGMWIIYAARPDNRIEGLGDEGPRVDQKDETRRVIDVIAQLTRDPVLSTYSRHLEQVYGDESYYRGYRWAFPLFNDPTVLPTTRSPANTLNTLSDTLPKASLFGRGAFNLGYIRSGWGANDTFISFRAGASLSHHGHYDAGHFTLFKGAPLAVNASRYSAIFDDHRLNFAIRTVAKNSLLILRPDEKVSPNRFFNENISDGGQRITLPTGSTIRDVDQWRRNLGKGLHLEGGQVDAWQHQPNDFTYVSTDLTGAYNRPEHDVGGTGGKVRSVKREFVYLRREDILVVRDRIVSVKPHYTKKWLLNTVTRPSVENAKVLKGTAGDGISESTSPIVRVENGKGRLIVQKILPPQSVIRLVGGANHKFYVETDGDETKLDGRNIGNAPKPRPWFDDSGWRIEIQPAKPAVEDEFLVALIPSIDRYRDDRLTPVPLSGGEGTAVATADAIILFVDGNSGRYRFTIPGNQRWIYVLGGSNKSQIVAKTGIAETPFARALISEKSARLTTIAPTGTEILIDVGAGP